MTKDGSMYMKLVLPVKNDDLFKLYSANDAP